MKERNRGQQTTEAIHIARPLQGIEINGEPLTKTVAVIPKISGVYETIDGEISVKVCPREKQSKTQKIIFTGNLVRESETAGGSQRRVVKFPHSNKPIRHDTSPTEFLIFHVQKVGKTAPLTNAS